MIQTHSRGMRIAVVLTASAVSSAMFAFLGVRRRSTSGVFMIHSSGESNRWGLRKVSQPNPSGVAATACNCAVLPPGVHHPSFYEIIARIISRNSWLTLLGVAPPARLSQSKNDGDREDDRPNQRQGDAKDAIAVPRQALARALAQCLGEEERRHYGVEEQRNVHAAAPNQLISLERSFTTGIASVALDRRIEGWFAARVQRNLQAVSSSAAVPA